MQPQGGAEGGGVGTGVVIIDATYKYARELEEIHDFESITRYDV